MNRNTDIFEKASIPKAALHLALPTVFSMLVTILYNMADTYFVGQTKDPNQVAAVTLATPVFLLLMALGNIFGIGGSSYISRSLGENNTERVKKISAFCFYACIGVGVIMIPAFFFGAPQILGLIGSTPATDQYTMEYFAWIAAGAPFVVFSNAYSNVLRGEGAAKISMIGMMVGTVANIALDPIMILTLGWGVAGAAIATIIGNMATCAVYLLYLFSKRTLLSCSPRDFSFKDGIAAGVLSIGIPACLTNMLMSVSNIILNNFLAEPDPVAAWGVASKANMMVILIQIGVAAGVQPLVGYCFGSGNFKRMKAAMKFACAVNIVFGSVVSVVYLLFTDTVIGAFIDNPTIIGYGSMMLRALMISAPVVGVMFVMMNSLQAMGRAISSFILSLSRQGLVFIPLLFILSPIFGLDGIVYAQPTADLVALVISVIMYIFISKRLKKYAPDKAEVNE